MLIACNGQPNDIRFDKSDHFSREPGSSK
jgi:hypothetical protein